jgi:hypothetical protein
VIIIQAKLASCSLIFFSKSYKSTNPSLTFTGTTVKPANTADAGFVPWADKGIKQMLR